MPGIILVPTDTFVVEHNGNTVFLRKGITRVREGHPITKGREDLFEPMTVDYDDDVEQATAAPGEKRRGTSRAKGDAAKRATEDDANPTEG